MQIENKEEQIDPPVQQPDLQSHIPVTSQQKIVPAYRLRADRFMTNGLVLTVDATDPPLEQGLIADFEVNEAAV